MIIRGSLIVLSIMGFVLFLLAKIDYLFTWLMFDYIGVILMMAVPFLFIYLLNSSRTGKLFDRLAPGDALIPFIRRDGTISVVTGTASTLVRVSLMSQNLVLLRISVRIPYSVGVLKRYELVWRTSVTLLIHGT